jgi:hypothetical protein
MINKLLKVLITLIIMYFAFSLIGYSYNPLKWKLSVQIISIIVTLIFAISAYKSDNSIKKL